MARKQGVQTLTELAESFGVSVGHMETGYYAPSVWLRPGGNGYKLIRPDANPDADPNHPFYDQVIVFSGALMSSTRQMAHDRPAEPSSSFRREDVSANERTQFGTTAR